MYLVELQREFDTSKLYAGVVIPIPTLPPLNMIELPSIVFFTRLRPSVLLALM
jgi:hypothetical protein